MSWKDPLNKAVQSVKEAAESDTAQHVATRARESTSTLANKTKTGALSAADAFIAANGDPSAMKIRLKLTRMFHRFAPGSRSALI